MSKYILLALLATPLHAGPFLDLDIGVSLVNHMETDGSKRYISDENPIGVMRIGYETKYYQLWKNVDIGAHGYWQHMSSAINGSDTGVDVLMFGVSFK